MLGLDRSAARVTWTAAAVVLLLWLIYMLRTTLFVFALALLFAYLLSPLVNLINRDPAVAGHAHAGAHPGLFNFTDGTRVYRCAGGHPGGGAGRHID